MHSGSAAKKSGGRWPLSLFFILYQYVIKYLAARRHAFTNQHHHRAQFFLLFELNAVFFAGRIKIYLLLYPTSHSRNKAFETFLKGDGAVLG
jgi:hypothetical protein